LPDLSPILVQVKLQADQLKADLDATTTKLQKFGGTAKAEGGHVSEFGDHINRLVKGFLGFEGAMKALDFLKESGKAAAEDAKSSALLERQLQNTTGATKEQSAAVEESIRSMSEQYGVLDDKIRPAYANLVRVTKDTGEATKLTDLAMNVAAGTGKDLTAVSQALAKAHEGQMGALTRLLPSVKGMKDPMAELTTQFAGAATTAANNDPYQRLTVTFDHIKESVGTALLPVIQQFADWLTKVAPVIENFFKSINNPATEAGRQFKQLKDAVGGVVKFFFDNFETIKNFGVAFLVVAGAIKTYNIVMGVMQTVTAIATAAQWALNVAMDANPIGIIIVAIGALVAALVYFFTQTDVGKKAWSDFVSFISDSLKNIGKFFSDTWQGVVKGWNAVLKWFQDLPGHILSFVADAGKWLLDVGKNIVAGLWQGIQNAWNGLISGFNALVNLLPDAIKKVLGIKSPSTVFAGIGTNIADGLAQGIYGGIPTAVAAVQSMGTKLVGAATAVLDQVMNLQSQAISVAGGNGALSALVYANLQTGMTNSQALTAAQGSLANTVSVGGMDVTALIAQAQAAANSATGGYQLYVNPTTGAVSRVQGDISASELNAMGLGANQGFIQVNLNANTNATPASIAQAVVDGIKFNAGGTGIVGL